ncbi:aminomethyl-transferring glycine dehydrogenase subunit GcvPA [Youngiibacter multivorans]|uniref:Probable glycine dehydrogenase (decarboxylating) subunit 1 n=1 Tax=Youngiibacter multivorans TaxID=937251 RepID=A0ABS4G0T3_9CLOT|nr:aminomethyl-transferring glycine dehydrogenase subunit GcvPA [Youngiibacter multivorans]MBP1918107.1 glycine dehydrogenase subunit 1 [Youngiibacter multivorans]
MHRYLPNTTEDIRQMLEVIGIDSTEKLFGTIPDRVKLGRELDIPQSKSEIEVRREIGKMAGKNLSADDLVCFRGAGSYDRYIPSAVKHIVGRSEFYTAYTPYQPEISQGTLQSVFEYQSMICSLTGMDVSNVSMYDGATSAAEAAILASVHTRRPKVLVSMTVNPMVREVLSSYLKFRNVDLEFVAEKDGETDSDDLKMKLDGNIAGLIVQYPNFYGIIEDIRGSEEAVHGNKSLLIVSTDPVSLGILTSPGELKADIVVGEAQGLGQNMNFGGPVLGFMTATEKVMRKLPGRIVGETTDVDGKRAFVLTLQAREQHIRREKATSNICSDQTLNSITAAVYMAAMGKEGIREVADQSFKKAHYAYRRLIETGKFRLLHDKPFFSEFALVSDRSIEDLNRKLLDNGILGGLDISGPDASHGNVMLIAVTENRTKAEIDRLVEILEVE